MPTPEEIRQNKEDSKRMLAEMTAGVTDVATGEVKGKILLFGVKGTGKSVLAAAIAKALVKGTGKKVLYVDTSDGWVSLRNHPSILKDQDFKKIPFESFKHLHVLAKAIRANIAPFDNVGAVIFDELSKMAMFERIEIVQKNHPTYSTPEWPDYNELGNNAQLLLKRFFTIPGLHIVAIAHERDKVIPSKPPVRVWDATPDFNPAVSKVVCEDMHLVARITAEEKKDLSNPGVPSYVRTAQVHPTFRIDTKSRIGGLNIKVSTIDLLKRIEAWVGEGMPEADIKPPVIVPEEIPVAEAEAEAELTEIDEADWVE